MISEKEFDHDAAMLAGIVGGHLNYVDKLTSDTSMPANKIDINKFIQPLRGGPPPMANPHDPVNRGTVPEEFVRTQAPDIQVNLVPTPNVISSQPPAYPIQSTSVTQPIVSSSSDLNEFKEDIKSIKSTLLKIDSTFSKIAGMIGKVFNTISQQETFIKK